MNKQIASVACAVAPLLVAGTAQASTYYLIAADSNNTNWNIPGEYSVNPDGTGGTATTLTGNGVDLNGYIDGTNSGTIAFAGNSIALDGGTLNLRNGGLKTVGVITGGGNATITTNGGSTLAVTTFSNPTGAMTLLTCNAGGDTLYNTFTTLSGGGNLELTGSGTGDIFVISVATGTSFTGNITWPSGGHDPSLEFGNEGEDLGGGVIANDSVSSILLNEDVTLASLTLDSTSLSPGDYSYSTLYSEYPLIFTAGGSGSITIAAAPVPEPSIPALAIVGLVSTLACRRRRPGALARNGRMNAPLSAIASTEMNA